MKTVLVRVFAALLVLAGTGFAGTAAAAATISKNFGPVLVTDIPATPTEPNTPATQKVVPLAAIDTPITAGATAYVYSTLRAHGSTEVSLVDNEVRCSGAGSSNVVMGENVLPSTGDPARQDITIVTRFLVSATRSGTLVCQLYLRTASTSYDVGQLTVEGTLRFALLSVGEDANGSAMQKSMPAGNLPVTDTVTNPVLDRTLPAGYQSLAVIADVEYHRCADGRTCVKQYSTARFELTVTTSGGPDCASAPVARSEERVVRGVNHAAVPLYTNVPVRPGCNRVHAEVTTTYLDGDVGTVGGAATKLTDGTGQTGTPPYHTSVMTHVFAVPS